MLVLVFGLEWGGGGSQSQSYTAAVAGGRQEAHVASRDIKYISKRLETLFRRSAGSLFGVTSL
ncbi:hypothetical protein T492DRAFT_964228 [Pavlovales sp. CCMP2436]|nr:hypothetical protein T492DRAFT_964228 [Pavlovales sp. CCMP2436]